MAFVFFVYGLAFFSLGLAILVYPKRQSAFSLAPALNLIAAFGVAHGLNEWLDLFVLIHPPASAVPPTLAVVRAALLPLSFLFLITFGVHALVQNGSRPWRRVLLAVTGLTCLWGLVVLGSDGQRLLAGDIAARYLIGLPGALLTAAGLYRHLRQLRRTRLVAVMTHLRLMIALFVAYGLLAGAIVKPAAFWPASWLNYEAFRAATGLPVQVFRALAAALLAYATLRVLRVFHWETQQRLEEGDLRVRTLAAAAPLILFEFDRRGVLQQVIGQAPSATESGEGWIGHPVTTLFPDLALEALTQRAWGDGEVYHAQITSGPRSFYLCATPTRGGDGSLAGFVGAALDVSDRLAQEAEIADIRRQLAQARQRTELGAVSKTVARQLWEPLGRAQRLLQRALSEGDPAARTALVEETLAEIGQVEAQIQDLGSRPTERPAARIALRATLQRIATVSRQRAREVHLEMVVHAPETVPRLVLTERELEYVAGTFVECALDHARPEVPSTLTLEAEVEGASLQLGLTHSGLVLSEEERRGLFAPFPETIGVPGCGLSMAVANEIIRSRGGAVVVEALAEEGTRLCVTLPIAPTSP